MWLTGSARCLLQVQVGPEHRRYLDASDFINWFTYVKSTSEPEAQNMKPFWAGQVIKQSKNQSVKEVITKNVPSIKLTLRTKRM